MLPLQHLLALSIWHSKFHLPSVARAPSALVLGVTNLALNLALDLALDLALAPRVVPKVDVQFCRVVAPHIVLELLSQAIHFCGRRHYTRPPAADQQVSAPQLRRLLTDPPLAYCD